MQASFEEDGDLFLVAIATTLQYYIIFRALLQCTPLACQHVNVVVVVVVLLSWWYSSE